MAGNKIFELYQDLREKYNSPQGQWNLWCQRPKTKSEREEVIIGAILTQRTNWKNVELALNNLKKAGVYSLKGISRLGVKKLAPLIRPSGFYQAKAKYLFQLAKFILKNYDNLDKIKRGQLLELKGLGPETADSILLYALDKPVFVIDEYTRRLVKEKNLAKNLSYDFLQKLFEENLKKDFRLYQDFHALIVIDGKDSDKK